MHSGTKVLKVELIGSDGLKAELKQFAFVGFGREVTLSGNVWKPETSIQLQTKVVDPRILRSESTGI